MLTNLPPILLPLLCLPGVRPAWQWEALPAHSCSLLPFASQTSLAPEFSLSICFVKDSHWHKFFMKNVSSFFQMSVHSWTHLYLPQSLHEKADPENVVCNAESTSKRENSFDSL